MRRYIIRREWRELRKRYCRSLFYSSPMSDESQKARHKHAAQQPEIKWRRKAVGDLPCHSFSLFPPFSACTFFLACCPGKRNCTQYIKLAKRTWLPTNSDWISWNYWIFLRQNVDLPTRAIYFFLVVCYLSNRLRRFLYYLLRLRHRQNHFFGSRQRKKKNFLIWDARLWEKRENQQITT